MAHGRWLPAFLLATATAGCAGMISPDMGSPVTGERFEREIAGKVMSFKTPDNRLAEAQFQPGGTAVYSGDLMDGVGRWRAAPNGYCALYPWLGRTFAARPAFGGPPDAEGYRCYDVRAVDGYYVLFDPDGTYAATLAPID